MKTTSTQHQLFFSFFFGCLLFASTPVLAPQVSDEVREYFKGFRINLSNRDIYSADEVADINAMHTQAKKFVVTAEIAEARSQTAPIVGLRGDAVPHSPAKLISEMRARMGTWYPTILQLQTHVNTSKVPPPGLPLPPRKTAIHDAVTGISAGSAVGYNRDLLLSQQSMDFLKRTHSLGDGETVLKKGPSSLSGDDASSISMLPSTRRSARPATANAHVAESLKAAVTAARQDAGGPLSPTASARNSDDFPLSPRRPQSPPPYRAPSMLTFRKKLYREPAPYGMQGSGSARRFTRRPQRLFLQDKDPAAVALDATRSLQSLAEQTGSGSEVVAVVHGVPPLPAPPTPRRPVRQKLGSAIVKTHNKVRGLTAGNDLVKMHNTVRKTRQP